MVKIQEAEGRLVEIGVTLADPDLYRDGGRARDAAQARLTSMDVRPGYAYAIRVTIPPHPAIDILDDKKDAAWRDLQALAASLRGPDGNLRLGLAAHFFSARNPS